MLSPEENALLTQTDPGTPMGELFRRFWIPAFLSEELPAPDCPPIRMRLLGEDLVAFRATDGTVGLIDARCPHRRADLFFGRNEEQGLRCVYHGWKFDVEGNCVDMPNEPAESNFKSKITTTAYPTQERGGMVWAYMGPRDFTPEMPALEWSLVPDENRYMLKMFSECNYLQAVEGDVDNSHASMLHAGIGGDSSMPLAERVKLGGGPRAQFTGRPARQQFNTLFAKDTTPRGVPRDTDYGVIMGWRREADEEHYYWRINHWIMPSYVNLASPAGNTMLCNVRVPVDDNNNWFYRIMWNPHRPLTEAERYEYRYGGVVFPEMIPGTFRTKETKANDYLIDRSLQKTHSYTGIKSIPQQDRAVSELDPIIDRSKEHLGTSDVVLIALRRKLLQAVDDLRQGIAPYPAEHGDVCAVRGVDILLARDVDFADGAKDQIMIAG